jgi:signal peptidase II
MFKETLLCRVILVACISGGGIGNLADRLFNSFRVIDFLNFGFGNVRTGILNVADLSVTFGVLILALLELRNGRKEKKSVKKPQT